MNLQTARVIDTDDPLRKALNFLKEEGFVVVTKNGRYAGELTVELIAAYGGIAPSTKAGSVARKGAYLQAPVQTANVLKKFAEGRLEGLAVLDGNQRVLGQFGKREILQELVEQRSLEGTVAGAASPIYSLEEDQTAAQARRMMTRNGWKAILVTKDRQATGKLTVADLALKVSAQGGVARRTRSLEEKVGADQGLLKDVMQPVEEGDYIESTASLEQAAARLARKGAEPLLVVEGRKLKGMLGFHDLLKPPQAPANDVRVEVSGLDEETKWFKDSIEEEARKLARKVGGNAQLQLRVKSLRKMKNRKEYEVSARLRIGNQDLFASSSKLKEHRQKWDFHLTVKETLNALENAWKHKSKK